MKWCQVCGSLFNAVYGYSDDDRTDCWNRSDDQPPFSQDLDSNGLLL